MGLCTLIHRAVAQFHQHHHRHLDQHRHMQVCKRNGVRRLTFQCNRHCKEGNFHRKKNPNNFIEWIFFRSFFVCFSFLRCMSVLYFYFCFRCCFRRRLSTKSMLNLNTKSIIGHVLKHGYVNFYFIFIFYSLNYIFKTQIANQKINIRSTADGYAEILMGQEDFLVCIDKTLAISGNG